ncbi:MAG TPA: glycine zipper 2TM domain-containing protein [Casimicrobiaceae bacterium]|nr:glycine zipper 2TM domain-containing protein [Casimicrobiaceae bacterium]
MSTRIPVAGVVVAAAMGLPLAHAVDFTDQAPVVATAPVHERVNAPKQECWNETVTTPAQSSGGSALGAIVGGIAGGVIGHQIGSGRGNAVATGVGAVAGAVIGDNVDPNGGVITGRANAGTQEQVVQRCRMVDNWQDVVRGYDVTYRYNGRDVTIRMPYDPGPTVQVAVGVIQDPQTSYNGPPPR